MSDTVRDKWGNEYVLVSTGGGFFTLFVIGLIIFYLKTLSEEIATAFFAIFALTIFCIVRHSRLYGVFSSLLLIALTCLAIRLQSGMALWRFLAYSAFAFWRSQLQWE